MLALGIDFEMTGLDPKIHAVCEVGAVLWDTDFHRAVMSMGYLVQVLQDAPFEEEALTVSGLSFELISKYGKESAKGLRQLLYMYEQADFIVAHNGTTCDRLFLQAWITACGLDFEDNKLWIDTMELDYPNKRWSKQLTALAAYHGFLNPFPHQALSDVMTTLTILDKYPIEEVITYAKTPWIGVRVTLPFEKNQWAKDKGYFWYKNKVNDRIKFWMKKIKEDKFEEESAMVQAAGFSITKIEIPEGVY